eukprot:6187060-Pleurochrysis_carterae.AAC.3
MSVPPSLTPRAVPKRANPFLAPKHQNDETHIPEEEELIMRRPRAHEKPPQENHGLTSAKSSRKMHG